MKHATRILVVLIFGALCSLAPAAQEAEDEAPAEATLWDEVVKVYEAAKEQGEQVPKSVYDWVRNDLGSVGDWEYMVFELKGADSAVMEKKLNDLGTERWECIWIQPVGTKTRFVMKRPSRTYLKHLPLSQLLKMVPAGGAEGE
jgi:hypothetical protein